MFFIIDVCVILEPLTAALTVHTTLEYYSVDINSLCLVETYFLHAVLLFRMFLVRQWPGTKLSLL